MQKWSELSKEKQKNLYDAFIHKDLKKRTILIIAAIFVFILIFQIFFSCLFFFIDDVTESAQGWALFFFYLFYSPYLYFAYIIYFIVIYIIFRNSNKKTNKKFEKYLKEIDIEYDIDDYSKENLDNYIEEIELSEEDNIIKKASTEDNIRKFYSENKISYKMYVLFDFFIKIMDILYYNFYFIINVL